MNILNALVVTASVVWVVAVIGICIRVIMDVIKEITHD